MKNNELELINSRLQKIGAVHSYLCPQFPSRELTQLWMIIQPAIAVS